MATMQTDDAIKLYGTASELARQLGITPTAVIHWKARNKGLIPELYARRLDDMTNGLLAFKHADYGLPPPLAHQISPKYRRARGAPNATSA